MFVTMQYNGHTNVMFDRLTVDHMECIVYRHLLFSVAVKEDVCYK